MLKFLPTCAETLEGKYYCLTCHPCRYLSSRMYPIRKQLQMSITICIHLVRGGGGGTVVFNTTMFPPIGGCQNGAVRYAPNNSFTRGHKIAAFFVYRKSVLSLARPNFLTGAIMETRFQASLLAPTEPPY